MLVALHMQSHEACCIMLTHLDAIDQQPAKPSLSRLRMINESGIFD